MDRFTTREAARMVGVSRRTFQRWVSAHEVESQVEYGPTGATHLYTRTALEHLVQQVRGEEAAQAVSRLDAGSRGDDMADPAPPGQVASSPPRQGGEAPAQLALPPSAQVEEFLTLLADMRDVVARAAGAEEKVGRVEEELGKLREVLSAVAARLPAPPAPPSTPPRFRPRAVLEVVLLGWVVLFAGVLGAVVLQRLADVGVVTMPAWWPLG